MPLVLAPLRHDPALNVNGRNVLSRITALDASSDDCLSSLFAAQHQLLRSHVSDFRLLFVSAYLIQQHPDRISSVFAALSPLTDNLADAIISALPKEPERMALSQPQRIAQHLLKDFSAVPCKFMRLVAKLLSHSWPLTAPDRVESAASIARTLVRLLCAYMRLASLISVEAYAFDSLKFRDALHHTIDLCFKLNDADTNPWTHDDATVFSNHTAFINGEEYRDSVRILCAVLDGPQNHPIGHCEW